ncbi:MAG: tRNA pseudouridine(55) synthase TruB, partial [bacterium]
MLNGMLNIYKEAGYTSSDVVAKLRGILHMRKIGHTGTLDPMAEGVLPVCLGNGTKLASVIEDRDKEYRAVMRLGIATDTQDMTGKVLEEAGEEHLSSITPDMIREACVSFIGDYDQIPPMYSAIKLQGKKLYELARAGKTVERKARRVRILDLEVEKIEMPLVTFRVVCSKGTYIRTLCEDAGKKLGC